MKKGGRGITNYELRVTNYEWTSDARGARYVTQRVVLSSPPPLKRAGEPPAAPDAMVMAHVVVEPFQGSGDMVGLLPRVRCATLGYCLEPLRGTGVAARSTAGGGCATGVRFLTGAARKEVRFLTGAARNERGACAT